MTIIYLKIAANADGTTVYVRLCLRIWIAENIGSLGSQTDATNLKYILRGKGRRTGESGHD